MPSADTPTVNLPRSACESSPSTLAGMHGKRRPRRTILERGMRIGVWRIERELGRGGMATVYAVVHTRFGKRAALKLAHRAASGQRLTPETFLREARTANLIDHPGVAEVFATGTYEGRPYLAMELLSGRSLGARIDPMPRGEALEILIELCDVLAAAHAAGITHRDIKLDNVLVLDVPGINGRRTKLLDWGMARIAGEDDPLRNLIAGTLTYVAPEQVRGDEITPAADVYALSVLAYKLLLGEPPFAATNDLELIELHLHATPPRPRTLWPAIPRELETTLLAMLAKQPADRPALHEVVRVLSHARSQLRPSKLRWVQPPAVPIHGIGRLALRLFATRDRVAGMALILALAIASLLGLFSA